MAYKNIKRDFFYYETQSCLDTENLISCLIADYFLIRRGKFPFASALYYILQKSISNQTYIQNIPNKKKKLQEKSKVITANFTQHCSNENSLMQSIMYPFSELNIPITKGGKLSIPSENKILNKEEKMIMTHANQDNDDKCNFQHSKVYYFDKSGMPIDECEGHKLRTECKKLIEACCRIKLPKGFHLTSHTPEICFNLSGLSCIKNPIVQEVALPACKGEHPKKCEVVAGYEIRAVGEVDFSVSLPICPIKGFCSAKHGHVCSSNIVPVNEIISHTCCPKPCSITEPCVDWTYAYVCTTMTKDECGSYILVNMGVALEYLGTCECDEE